MPDEELPHPPSGESPSTEQLFAMVYDQLRVLAARHLRNERPGHTLAPTALVHEAYLRLADGGKHWQDRNHFFAFAAVAMRRILVDHAKERHRQKRGGNVPKLSLEEAFLISDSPDPRIILIDEALDALARIDARKAKVVELLFFGGLTFEEASATIGLSVATLHREVKFAKAWISKQISSTDRP
jgi:RNA polymerase sigma factor (TIGR02999 family)